MAKRSSQILLLLFVVTFLATMGRFEQVFSGAEEQRWLAEEAVEGVELNESQSKPDLSTTTTTGSDTQSEDESSQQ